MPPSHHAALSRIAICRTAAAGGHVVSCRDCNQWHYRFKPCGDRNCPSCGRSAGEAWYELQANRLIDAPYFQVVATVPAELHRIFRSHQKVLYPLFMVTFNEALAKLAKDPKLIGGKLAVTTVLHTWGRTLNYHPHLHTLIPAVALNDDGEVLHISKKFFLPTRLIARIFRGKFMEAAQAALPDVEFPTSVWNNDWHVYAQPALQPRRVLKYLSRYLFRTAISNSRILEVDERTVTFAYTDHRDAKAKTMTLHGEEFLRRFLQHILPPRMHRIRYYGWAHSSHADTRQLVRQRLRHNPHPDTKNSLKDPDEDDFEVTGPWEPTCPHCGSTNISIIIADFPSYTRGPPPPLPVFPNPPI